MTKRILIAAALWALTLAAFAQGAGIVKQIVVKGNVNVSSAAITVAMKTKEGQPYSASDLDQDKANIEDLGYFQAVDVRPSALDNNNWVITVEVQEFPIVKEIRVTGNTVISTQEILKVVTAVPGKIFNLRQQHPSAVAIGDLYVKRGYFARVTSFMPLKDSPNTLNIEIVESKVKSVQVKGAQHTKPRVLQRLVRTRPGAAYNAIKWEADLKRLYSTRWFDTVRSEETHDDAETINLIADVTEARTGIFNVGVQLDPRNSFAGILKLADTNYKGTGQSVGVDFIQGTNGGGGSYGLDYGNPFIDSHDTSLHVSLYSRVLYRFTGNGFGGSVTPTTDNRYTERRTGSTIGVSRPINDTTYYSLTTRYEGISTGNISANAVGDFIKQDGTVVSLTGSYTQDRRDADIDASRGDWFSVSAEPGSSRISKVGGSAVSNSTNILGTHTFVKAQFEYRKYFTNQPRRKQLDDPRRVVAFRLRYGEIAGNVPFFEQFFAGGADTIRGFTEDRFWGKHQLLSTLEYRYPLQKAFNLIGFVDYGGAWGGYGTVGTFTQFSTFKMQLGYGLGLSFKTPLGPIRLDFGFNQHRGSRTYFQIGTSF